MKELYTRFYSHFCNLSFVRNNIVHLFWCGFLIGASLSEPHMVSSTRNLSVCLSVCLSSYVSVKLESFRKLNATHARSVQHHVQFGQFFPTVKRFVVESI